MNAHLNVPDNVCPGKKDYSWRTDFQVNGWLFVAALLSAFSDFFFPQLIHQWPVPLRTLVALAPFAAMLLWTRDVTRWIRGMDELHRRITVAAMLFAVSATFFFVMIWHGLERAGFFEAICPGRRNWDIGTVGHCLLLLILFYAFGHSRFNRRYK